MNEGGCADAEFCPSCGQSLAPDNVEFTDDLVFNIYRTEFVCPRCGFHGEVFRHGLSNTEFNSESEHLEGMIREKDRMHGYDWAAYLMYMLEIDRNDVNEDCLQNLVDVLEWAAERVDDGHS